MNRRQVLRSAGLAAVASINTVNTVAAAQTPGRSRPGPPAIGPFITTADGQQLFHRDWGAGQPMVFLAAWGLPSDMWGYQMVPLSESGFRTIAFDRRGHGRSSDPGRGYDFDTLADDLAAGKVPAVWGRRHVLGARRARQGRGRHPRDRFTPHRR